ncbi:hypothetical protein [Paraburkholderia youngii]|uniref:hypothetical protein n=1 Tax=Paraburkholderia youngii TaxID=2782701 RepID=UPI001590564A|nr:hypothetical protein [Paraburkholderia youngii]
MSEQTIHIDRNVWSSETSRTIEVNQYLSQSQSGKIDYVWGKIDPMSPHSTLYCTGESRKSRTVRRVAKLGGLHCSLSLIEINWSSWCMSLKTFYSVSGMKCG